MHRHTPLPLSVSRRSSGFFLAPALVCVHALMHPVLGVAVCAWLVAVRVCEPPVCTLALLAGLALRAQAVHWLSRSTRCPFPSIVRSAASTSRSDWARRLSTRPLREGWTSALIRSRDVRAAIGAALAPISTTAFVRFHAGRFAGQVVWCALSVGVCVPVLRVMIQSWSGRAGGIIAGLVALPLAMVASRVPALLCARGWRLARIALERALHHEYWPAWLFYAPLVPYALLLGLRTRGLLTPSACNPAIEHAGGWIGESKSAIMRALGASKHALTTVPVESGGSARARAERARQLMISHQLRFPVVLKPDAGQRGFGVKLARSQCDLEAYFAKVRGPVVIQPYHPGPCECGIFWLRHRSGCGGDGSAGRIFSVTRKEFPAITGDGVSTLEELIERHPRHRRQHRVFLERFRDDSSRVLASGEVLRLSMSGNHCQGTLFRDAGDLITPELSRVIDGLCAQFGAETGCPGGLDVTRLDVRYESDDLLRKGMGFAIVELNGTSAESTNIYDPEWSLGRAYGVLFAQWRAMYELGQARIKSGTRPVGVRELVAMIRAHYAERTGDPIAD